jgi:murein DD-endopeptidase MepM/ murein hydrolase activator NlpD
VVAIADGPIVRSSDGEVIQDLDGDGFEGTGWIVQYLHIEARDRVPAGTTLERGDPIGHPSCEGGVSSGTHLHLSRKFNGEWISADGALPFDLDGWVSEGEGVQYNGALTRADTRLEACSCRFPSNQISR